METLTRLNLGACKKPTRLSKISKANNYIFYLHHIHPEKNMRDLTNQSLWKEENLKKKPNDSNIFPVFQLQQLCQLIVTSSKRALDFPSFYIAVPWFGKPPKPMEIQVPQGVKRFDESMMRSGIFPKVSCWWKKKSGKQPVAVGNFTLIVYKDLYIPGSQCRIIGFLPSTVSNTCFDWNQKKWPLGISWNLIRVVMLNHPTKLFNLHLLTSHVVEFGSFNNS